MKERQEKVQIEIEKCHRRVEELSEYSDLSSIPHYCKEVGQIQKKLLEIQDQVVQINKEEELFKWDPSNFPEIDQIHAGLELYNRLFNTIQRQVVNGVCTTCTCTCTFTVAAIMYMYMYMLKML